MAKVVADGNHVEHWLNGVKLLEYQLRSDVRKKRIAASKFKDEPMSAKAMKGHMCLQEHSDRVESCNIKVQLLR